MLTFKKLYFVVAITLLLIEIAIARYVHDTIIRPFVGDLLVVILIYAFYRAFIRTTVFRGVLQVLLFAFTVEVLQLLNIVEWLGLHHSRLAVIILGSTFDWWDLLAYSLGGVIILIIERWRSGKK